MMDRAAPTLPVGKGIRVAVDYHQLRQNLQRFYDFANKTVLFVGAGGKQLLDPSVPAKKLIAIDRNIDSLAELKTNVSARGLNGSVEVIASNIEDIRISGDVVYFEFCLHEIADPDRALAHARSLAADIVVFDHLPDSEWSFYAAEDEMVRRGTLAMERLGFRRRETYSALQRFKDHAELQAKLAGQGTLAITRAEHFRGVTDIAIPMDYQLALL